MKKENIAVDWFKRIFPIALVIVALAAMAIPASAKNDSSDSMSATIRVMTATKIGGTELAPGQYKVTTDGTQAKIQKGSKVVAEVPCSLKPLSFMPATTLYVVDHDSISEIQVSGNIKAIEFSSGPSAGK